MRTAEAAEILTEQELFTKGWDLLKKYYYLDGNSTEEEIEQLLEEGNSITASCRGTDAAELAVRLVIAITEHIFCLYDKRTGRA